ncbi:MAG: alpha/beta hydrolase [Polyangiaceae bacterium]
MPKLTVATENKSPVELHYEDYGQGRPVVLIHGWPLSSRAWEAQVPALLEAGHRVVTYDRRGFGASSQPWGGYDYDTFAADLDALMTHLDLKDATLVGSMGGGEVARTIAKYGTTRAARAVFVSAVPPCLLKKSDNPEGPLDEATIASFHEAVRSDRLAFLDSFMTNFFSANGKLGGARPSDATRSRSRKWRHPRARTTASPRGGRRTSAPTSPRSRCRRWSFTGTRTPSFPSR